MIEARIAFIIVAGRKGSIHVVNPTRRLLFVRKQNMRSPQRRFTVVPRIIPIRRLHFHLLRFSTPRPMRKAIRGKERINPPVGPTKDCQPPVKFAKTGNPIAPSNIYINVERAPNLEPRIMPASVTAKVCIVIGTPRGIGMAICAIITMIAENKPVRQMFCMFECFISNLHFLSRFDLQRV